MCDQIDPISYKQNLTMPKMIIQSAGDEFFLPTDTKYFWDQLPGDNYLRILPNAEHEMALHGLSSPHMVYSSHTTFFMACNKASLTLPKITWEYETTDQTLGIRLDTDLETEAIELRRAETRGMSRLDFRLARARTEDDPPGRVAKYLIIIIHG